jgi:hypothetical protein
VSPSGEHDKVTSTFPYRKREKKPLSLYSDKEADPTTPRRPLLCQYMLLLDWYRNNYNESDYFQSYRSCSYCKRFKSRFSTERHYQTRGHVLFDSTRSTSEATTAETSSTTIRGKHRNQESGGDTAGSSESYLGFSVPLTLVGSQMMRLGHPKTSVSRRS